MKNTLTMITAAVFAAALAIPAFAQVGAGIAGNGTVGEKPTMGANPDVSNSDPTRADPLTPNRAGAASAMPPSESSSRHSKVVESDRNRGVGVNAGVNPSAGSANANPSTDNSSTGGY